MPSTEGNSARSKNMERTNPAKRRRNKMRYGPAQIVAKILKNGFEEIKPFEVHSAIIELDREVEKHDSERKDAEAREKANNLLKQYWINRAERSSGLLWFSLFIHVASMLAVITYLIVNK